jgi:uncharacterized membrane protein YcjF (UPF0283 family)
MVQDFIDVILPVVFLLAFAVAIAILVARLVTVRVRLWNANRRLAGQQHREHHAEDVMHQEAARNALDAIAMVIGELEAHPATYETFPAEIRDMLFAVYNSNRMILERKSPRK